MPYSHNTGQDNDYTPVPGGLHIEDTHNEIIVPTSDYPKLIELMQRYLELEQDS